MRTRALTFGFTSLALMARRMVVLSAIWLTTGVVSGVTLYWDTNGTTAGAGTASGTWSTGGGAANNRWNTIAGGGSGGTIGKWTSGSDAVFSAGTDNTGSFTVTLAANQNVSSITVEEGSPTFTSNSITFNDASPDFTVAGGSTATVNSGIAGTNGLNKLGAGTLIFATTDKAYTGTTTISAGILQLNFNQSFDTVDLAGGELLLNSATTTITNLNLTANSIIDFATAATLTVTNLNLNGFTLTVQNWANASDFFFATNWTGAVPDTSNAAPMNQVAFDGFTVSDTKWMPYGSHEVTPVPEPSTYGAILLGAVTGFLAWRRLVRRPTR